MSLFFSVLIYSFYMIIFVILFINVIAPRYLWEKFESWQAKRQPSEAYFQMRRITSLIGLLIMTLIMAGPTIKYWLDK